MNSNSIRHVPSYYVRYGNCVPYIVLYEFHGTNSSEKYDRVSIQEALSLSLIDAIPVIVAIGDDDGDVLRSTYFTSCYMYILTVHKEYVDLPITFDPCKPPDRGAYAGQGRL